MIYTGVFLKTPRSASNLDKPLLATLAKHTKKTKKIPFGCFNRYIDDTFHECHFTSFSSNLLITENRALCLKTFDISFMCVLVCYNNTLKHRESFYRAL